MTQKANNTTAKVDAKASETVKITLTDDIILDDKPATAGEVHSVDFSTAEWLIKLKKAKKSG